MPERLTMNPRQTGEVLVVDDDESIREVLGEILVQEGIPVRTCGSGREALAQIEEGLSPALILLDLRMPDVDGVEFCRILDTMPTVTPRPPVVVLSGDRDACDNTGGLPVERCLLKPIDLEELLRIIERHRVPAA